MSSTRNHPQASKIAELKNSARNEGGGGGGAESSHGMVFHLTLAMLMLLSLKDMSQADLGIQYQIWLEREGYGKFDDIVIKYEKLEGESIQICIQCKSGAENDAGDISRIARTTCAHDFLSGKNRQFSLATYLKSFSEVKDVTHDCKTYYIILTNRGYASDKDGDYPFFQREEINDISGLFFPGLLVGKAFKIKYNCNLSKHILTQLNSDKNNNIKFDSKIIEEFCDKFLYICDNRKLEIELNENFSRQCNGNEAEIKKLKVKLHKEVWEMYKHKSELNNFEFTKFLNDNQNYYNVEPAHPKFTGREEEIKQIKSYCDCKKGKYILDVLVTGMAGMGKTQVVRKYIEENKQNYKNIIWINAENNESLENSFIDLAKFFHLTKTNRNYEIADVNKAVYTYFRERTLFVFDNADKALLLKSNNDEYIYLPRYEESTKNNFIVISQITTWTTNNPTVTLDKYSEEEALLYLDTVIECTKEEKQEIAARVHYWPLALCLAASYIQFETDNSLGRKCVSDVVKCLQIDHDNFYNYVPDEHEMQPYNTSLCKLWQMIQATLQRQYATKLSQNILYILSFSYPENFPINLLKFDRYSDYEVQHSISLLRDNSLVTVENCNISINRVLPDVIRKFVMSDTNLYINVIFQAVDCFNNYLNAMNVYECKKNLGNIHMVTFLHHVNKSDVNLKTYVNLAEKLLRRLYDSNDILVHGKKGGIFDQILLKANQDLSGNCETTLRLMNTNALMLEKLGQFYDALCLYNEILKVLSVKFGKSHRETLVIMNNKASVLYHIGKYNEALNIINEVIDENTIQNGKDHLYTINSLGIKASVLLKLEKFKEVLCILNQQIKVMKEKLGKCHPETLTCISNKATVLALFQKHAEALIIFDKVIEVQTDNLGTDHLDTVSTLHGKASVLYAMGKYNHALSIYDEVIQQNAKNLGKDHPYIIVSMRYKASVLRSMGKYNQALRICNEVIEMETERSGKYHPRTLQCLNYKALLLSDMGNHDEALILYNQFIEISSDMLGYDHHDTLTSMKNKAYVLIIMGRYTESQNVFNQLIDLEIRKLGKNHLQTATSINTKEYIIDIIECNKRRSENFSIRASRRMRRILKYK